uniref:hypothetical protein n=1 Tax=Ndongobacter massiliensis TaxID=1871025 RepID=UPI000931EBC5|nr:hypothetical protein [Ndongobacter massiliensis]
MKSRTRIVAIALSFCMILGAFAPAAESFAQEVPAETSEAKSEVEMAKENIPEEPTEPKASKDSAPEESVKPEVGKETIPEEVLQESAEAALMEKSSKENPMPAAVPEAMQALEASAGEPVMHQVTFVFNKEVSGAVVPTAISVESGNEITLPSVDPDVLGDQSFLYWEVQGQKMDPGAKVTVDEDCTITGIWEGAYGKVSISFITGELTYKNWKYGFEEVASLDGYEATLTKGDASYEPERKEDGTYYYTKLTKGAYNFTVKVPENMEIVGIYDGNKFAATKQPVEFEGNVITLPFLNYNLSLGKSLYVLVKEKPVENVTVTYAYKNAPEGIEAPETVSVAKGSEITLPSVDPDVVGDMSFLYWDVQGQKMDPGAKVTVDEDCTITGIWEGAYGKVSISFITGELTYKDWKYGFEEVASLDGYEATLTKGDASYEPERKEDGTYYYTKLTKGAYNFTVKVPENMEIIGIYDANEFAATKQPVEFKGNVITLPFLSYNLSLGKSLYVLVKEKPDNPDNTNTENTETSHPENPDNAQSKDPEIVNPEQPNNPQPNESKPEKVVEKTEAKTVVETKRSSEKTAAKTGDAFSVTAALLLMTLSGIGFYATRRKRELID